MRGAAAHLVAWATAPLVPLAAVAAAAHPRLRADLGERLGIRVPPVAPGALWVHAASVGELAVVDALVPHLDGPLLVTTDSDTGAAAARARGWCAAALPFDHPFCFAPLLSEARPRGLVFVESAFWPFLAAEVRRRGVPVLRVSARESARTAAVRDRLPAWFAADRIWARDDGEARRLQGRGTVAVGGDLKSARPIGPPTLSWPGPFAVGASLRGDDVERFLAVAAARGVRALVAPRHPSRHAPPPGAVLRSELPGGRVPDDVSVVWLDTVGSLAPELAGAEWVFVGGTFDPAIGGHSPWEAARAGAPVVAGPCVAAQGDAFARVGAVLDRDLAAAVARRRPPSLPPIDPVAVARGIEAACPRPGPEVAPRPALWPLVPLVQAAGLAARLRPRRAAPVPVVAVGSTNARSPGRTSTVRALVGALAPLRVGVATRGYRRARGGRDLRCSWDTADAADLGDEGALLAQAGALVVAGPDRVRAAHLLAGQGAELVILDDGPGVALRRDLEIAVVDARFPRARGPLPAGDRRAPEVVPPAAHLVLVHHGGGRFAYPGLPAGRSPGPWVRGDGAEGPPAGPVALWTAVGRGADVLAAVDVPIARVRLDPDHTTPDPEGLAAFAGALPLVCTAKDAVRLPSWLRARAAWRELRVLLPRTLVDRVRGLVRPTGTGSG